MREACPTNWQANISATPLSVVHERRGNYALHHSFLDDYIDDTVTECSMLAVRLHAPRFHLAFPISHSETNVGGAALGTCNRRVNAQRLSSIRTGLALYYEMPDIAHAERVQSLAIRMLRDVWVRCIQSTAVETQFTIIRGDRWKCGDYLSIARETDAPRNYSFDREQKENWVGGQSYPSIARGTMSREMIRSTGSRRKIPVCQRCKKKSPIVSA